MKWWYEFDDTYKMGVLLSIVAVVAGIVACWVQPASEDRLVTHEVTLGDGTRATCVVVQGVRSAGVTCVPHVTFDGHDAEEVTP